MLVLNKSRELLDYLGDFQADEALRHSEALFGARSTCGKVERLMELLQDRRRQVDQRMRQQRRRLEVIQNICQWEQQEQEVSVFWQKADVTKITERKKTKRMGVIMIIRTGMYSPAALFPFPGESWVFKGMTFQQLLSGVPVSLVETNSSAAVFIIHSLIEFVISFAVLEFKLCLKHLSLSPPTPFFNNLQRSDLNRISVISVLVKQFVMEWHHLVVFHLPRV